MKEKFDNEDLIIARDIAEAEAEWEKREREKYEKNKAELKAIAEHRALVVSNSLMTSKNQTKFRAIHSSKAKLPPWWLSLRQI